MLRRRLPDFLIIGAQRSGTTSLYEALAGHPGVTPATRKEIHYFDFSWERGQRWYRSHFPRRRGGITGEATPFYLFHREAAARAARVVPDARIVAVLRDPVARAISHYRHAVRRGHEDRPAAIALAADEALLGVHEDVAAYDDRRSGLHRRSYVRRGVYAPQLERWLAHYPRDRVAVFDFAAVVAPGGGGIPAIQRFLGLPVDSTLALPHRNATAESGPVVDEDVVVHLRALFRPHNERLRQLLGVDWPWLHGEPSA